MTAKELLEQAEELRRNNRNAQQFIKEIEDSLTE
jgi:hypothetical protein